MDNVDLSKDIIMLPTWHSFELWCPVFLVNIWTHHPTYRQISNIRHTKSQNLIVSCIVLQLSLCNLLKPGVDSKMKM